MFYMYVCIYGWWHFAWQIAREAESAIYHKQLFEELRMLTPRPTDVTHTTALAAVEASVNCMAASIVVITSSGRSVVTAWQQGVDGMSTLCHHCVNGVSLCQRRVNIVSTTCQHCVNGMSWGSIKLQATCVFLFEVASHVKKLPFRPVLLSMEYYSYWKHVFAWAVWSGVCRSAYLMAAYRPRCPIIAITRDARTARQLHLYRGIFPIHYKGEYLPHPQSSTHPPGQPEKRVVSRRVVMPSQN